MRYSAMRANRQLETLMADSELYAPSESFRKNAYFKSFEEYKAE